MSNREQIQATVEKWAELLPPDFPYIEGKLVALIDALSADFDRARAEAFAEAAEIARKCRNEFSGGADFIYGAQSACYHVEVSILATSSDPCFTQRVRDEALEEAARIAEKPRVVFGTPLTAMQELAQDIAAEIRAKRGTQDV